MKLTVAQWGMILGFLALVFVAGHWALSDAPKPTFTPPAYQPISPQTNWTNQATNPAQAVTTQTQGETQMGYGAQVFYEPVDTTTLRGSGGYEI